VREIEWQKPPCKICALDKESLVAFSRPSSASPEPEWATQKAQGIVPPEYRLRVGDYRVRFDLHGENVRVLRPESP